MAFIGNPSGYLTLDELIEDLFQPAPTLRVGDGDEIVGASAADPNRLIRVRFNPVGDLLFTTLEYEMPVSDGVAFMTELTADDF